MQCLGDAQRSCNHADDRMCSLPGDGDVVSPVDVGNLVASFNWPCGCLGGLAGYLLSGGTIGIGKQDTGTANGDSQN